MVQVLRTESLEAGWRSLLRRYPALPQVALPRVNEAGASAGGDREGSSSSHPWGPPPPVVYTPRLRALVWQLDGGVFRTFNYSR